MTAPAAAVSFRYIRAVVVAVCLISTAGAGEPLQVRVDGGRLTLTADAVPLADIVTTIGRQAGFTTTLIGDFATPVTLSLTGVPVSEAVERLLAHTDRIVIYDETPAATAGRSIVRVWLFEQGEGPAAATGAAADRADPLQHPDAKMRSQAVLALTLNGATDGVLVELGRILLEDDDPLVRSRAAIALGSLHDLRALAALEDALHDENFSVRAQALQALAQIDDEQAVEILGQVLLHDSDARLRVLAVQGLHRQDSPPAGRFLDAAADDPDPQVRSMAANPPRPALTTDLPPAGEDRQ